MGMHLLIECFSPLNSIIAIPGNLFLILTKCPIFQATDIVICSKLLHPRSGNTWSLKCSLPFLTLSPRYFLYVPSHHHLMSIPGHSLQYPLSQSLLPLSLETDPTWLCFHTTHINKSSRLKSKIWKC